MFFKRAEVARKAGVIAGNERKQAGGHRIERTEMPDGFFARDAAHAGNNVMGGHASRFVDKE